MIASLMMYARPELDGAHRRLWELIREQLALVGIDSPKHLSQQTQEFAVWRDPQLVLSQTCGMPYRNFLHQDVTLVGTPDYGLDDCAPGYYRSALVVRADDARDQLLSFKDDVFAYNQPISQSGYSAAYWHLKPSGFWFAQKLHTHSHVQSAQAVAQGRAAIASIDAVTWRLLQAHEPFADALRVLQWTASTPGLPLITAKMHDGGRVFAAVGAALEALPTADCAELGIKGLLSIPKQSYLAVPNPDLPECRPVI